MNSRDEIMHLINQYAFAIDQGDLDKFASLFEHGQYRMQGAGTLVGKQQLRDVLSIIRIYEDGTPRTKHVISNVDIQIDEANGAAKGQCYITVFQQTESFPLQVIFAGHYFDVFEKVNNHWRFKDRHICSSLIGDMSAHLNNAEVLLPSG